MARQGTIPNDIEGLAEQLTASMLNVRNRTAKTFVYERSNLDSVLAANLERR